MKLGKRIEHLTANVSQLEADLAASKVSFVDYETTKTNLDKALSSARKSLAMYKMHEKRMSQIFLST